jgi:hypothetical protein
MPTVHVHASSAHAGRNKTSDRPNTERPDPTQPRHDDHHHQPMKTVNLATTLPLIDDARPIKQRVVVASFPERQNRMWRYFEQRRYQVCAPFLLFPIIDASTSTPSPLPISPSHMPTPSTPPCLSARRPPPPTHTHQPQPPPPLTTNRQIYCKTEETEVDDELANQICGILTHAPEAYHRVLVFVTGDGNAHKVGGWVTGWWW